MLLDVVTFIHVTARLLTLGAAKLWHTRAITIVQKHLLVVETLAQFWLVVRVTFKAVKPATCTLAEQAAENRWPCWPITQNTECKMAALLLHGITWH
jgi:hypothetical protein